MTAATEPYEIHCAEVWGGVSVKDDNVATPGVHAAIHSSASGDAKGGDVYYFSVCAYDALTRIALADVRGHGQEVSHLSEWLYQSLEARMNDSDGAGVLTDLNQVVRKQGLEAITTAVVATIDRNKRQLSYAYAGHPPMFLGGHGLDWHLLKVAETQGPANLPLGVLPEARFTQETVSVKPGDRLFLYSDGVAECPGPDDSFYGDERMLDMLRRTGGDSVATARTRLLGDLTNYAAGPLIHDDCTFLLVEVLKSPQVWKRRFFAGKPRPEKRRAPL